MKQTTEYKLAKKIMEYWCKCIFKENDKYTDSDINDLLENLGISITIRETKLSKYYETCKKQPIFAERL